MWRRGEPGPAFQPRSDIDASAENVVTTIVPGQSIWMLPLRTISPQTFRSFLIVSLNSSGVFTGSFEKPIAVSRSSATPAPTCTAHA
jgi:hypothetical protein